MHDFHVPDMTSSHCVTLLTRALVRTDPACQVIVDLPRRMVRVLSCGDRARFVTAMVGIGYRPA